MDAGKKKALLKWIEALGKNRIKSFEDLRDGSHIISVLQSSELSVHSEHLIDSAAPLETTEQRYHVIKQYLEGFYNQSLFESKLLDIGGIVHRTVRGDQYDMEMGKLLLALLGGLIQDNVCREKVIQPALVMDERTQYEIKEMMELTLLMDSGLPQGFEDMLKSKTDEGAHHDTALFFKLVGEGSAVIPPSSPKPSPGTPVAPSIATRAAPTCNGPVFAMYSNSPQPGNSAGISIREISSPLRVMSLSSPVTPLGALMSSPQLAQKIIYREVDRRKDAEALFRQKAQEVKRLELAIQSEQHVRSELELDLQESQRLLKEKDGRIQEFERQFSDVRRLRDQLDEQELLKSEKENLGRDVSKLQARILELQDVREHNLMLERESRHTLAELESAREELKLLESVKKSSDEYRARAHKLQMEVSEVESSLEHSQCELASERAALGEARAMYDNSQSSLKFLRREKDELEEVLGARNGVVSHSFPVGECMSIVTEKQLSELQIEYDQMKASWVDPVQFSDVKQRLELETEAKKTYQEKYVEMKKQCLSVEAEGEKLAASLDLCRNWVAQLEASQQEAQVSIHDLRSQVNEFEEREDVLRRSESDLQTTCALLETRIQGLEKELAQCNTELQLTRREIEVHVEENETRRQTIVKLDTVNQERVAEEHRLSTEVMTWRHKAELTSGLLQSLKEEGVSKEAALNAKLQSIQNTLCQTESALECERIERDSEAKGLNEKLTRLEGEFKELNEQLETDKKSFRHKVVQMENKLKMEANLNQERLDCLNSVKKDFKEHKELCSCREESLTQEVNSLRKEKKSAEFECHKLKLEQQSATESFSDRYGKLEEKLAGCEAAYKQELLYMNSCREEQEQANTCLRSDISDLHRTIENQKLNIENINKVVDQFKADNRDLTVGLDESKLKVVDLELQLKNLGEKYAEEIEKNSLLQNELKTLLSKSDALKKDHESKISDLEDSLSQTETQFEKFRHEHEAMVSDKESRIVALQGELESLGESEKVLTSSLTVCQADYSVMQHMIQKKEDEKAKTEQLLKDRDDGIAHLEADLAVQREALDHAKVQMESLAEQHAAAVLNLKSVHEKELMDTTSESQCRQQEAGKVQECLEGRINELETMLQSKSESLVELERRCEIITGDKDSVVANLSGEIDTLTSDLTNSKSLLEQVKSVKEQLESEIRNLSENHDQLNSQFNLCQSDFSEQKANFEHAIEQLRLSNVDLEKSLQTSKSDVDDLEQKCAHTEQHWQSLCGQLKTEAQEEQERTQTEMNELCVSLQAKSESCSELERKCEMIVADKDSVVDKLVKEIDRLKANANESKAVNDHSKQTIKDLEAQLKCLDECKVNLEAELETCKTELTSVNAQLESQVENLTQGQDQLNSQLTLCKSDFSAQKEGYEHQLEQLQLSKLELEQTLETGESIAASELKELADKLVCTEQHLQTQCDHLKSEVENEQSHLKEVTLSLLSKTEECVALNKKYEMIVGDKDNVVAEMSGEIDSLTAHLNEKSTLIAKSEQMIQSLQAELAACKSELESIKLHLELQVRHLVESQDELNSQLNQCKSEIVEQKSVFERQVDLLQLSKVEVEQSLETYKSHAESELTELKDKLVETEHYWRSQCEQLEEEYSTGTEDQRLEYQQQLAASESEFTSRLEDLMDEKDLYIANEKQAYQDRVNGFEKALADKRREIEAVTQELETWKQKMAEQEVNYNGHVVKVSEQLSSVSERLESEQEHHRRSAAACETLKQKVAEVEENKKVEVEMLIGQYETQLDCLRANEVDVQKLTDEHKTETEKVESAMESQQCTYQSLISSLEEKLNSETSDLKERLSQMKCQYDTIIENKDKETRTQLREYEAKCSSLQQASSSMQTVVSETKEENIQLQSDLVMCSNRNSELVETVTSCQARLEESVSTVTGLQERVACLETELTSAQDEGRAVCEELGTEKGERTELERQLAYLRDQTDTLTAELSSQQQQLAAVEEEKRVVEMERLALVEQHEATTKESRRHADKAHHFAEVEKLEIERQLQSLQKCYDTVQKSMTESEQRVGKLESERNQKDTRCHELETRIHGHMEREAKMTADHLHHMNTAAELNSKLRRQVDEKCQEYADANAKFNKQLEDFQREAAEMKRNLEGDLQVMVKEKTSLEIDVATLQQVREKLTNTESERQKLQEINEKYNIHYNKKKETIAELTKQLTESRRQTEAAARSEQMMAKETAPLHTKLDGERIKTKTLAAKVRTLEAQNDLADRKLREYQTQLEKGNSVFLGDSSHFMQMVMDRQSDSDASFMAKHPSSVPLDDSLDDTVKPRYDLRARRSSCTHSVDETMTPGTRASRSRTKLAKSVSTATVISNGMTPGTTSIGSTSSLAQRLRFRESVSSLDKSVSSVESCRSNASNVPRGTGGLFHCDDEPMEFEWGRLGEMQRRNTLCPSHMKTSYPVETQTCRPTKFSERALRESTMKVNTSPVAPGSGRKRKTNWDSTDSGSDSSDSKKLAKAGIAGTVYQKPGPPTPANCRRNSGKGTSKSPSKRSSCVGSRSPRTPLGLRGKKTPRRTPRHTPRTSVRDVENIGSGKKANSRESISFSIGFSPKASCKRLRRQDGFIHKQPQSSSQTRKPLGTRNFQQTGV